MRGLWVAVVMCGMMTGARAADLPILRGGFTDGLSASHPNWEGFYVGGQADWGSIRSSIPANINADLQGAFVPPPNYSYGWAPLGTAHSTNTGFGAFAGYNGQWDDVVLGVEANYVHGGFSATSSGTGYTYDLRSFQATTMTHSTATVGVSDFGSLRLRGGYAIGCFLPYGFIGAGFGDQTVDRSVSATPAPMLSPATSASKEKLVYGYSAGVGFDVMLVGGLFARAEYEYQRVTSDIESNINTVRAGLGYKF
ncbi:outer membrane beta-barrel protein [Bradyrhizobium sp. ARR65]|uniref:outer membrane protein n=1 Tax=Bradyrhizobium sp. ARR65 TaxID=1040989 RepID=UPI000466A983|nr:outer membrane beta-barrel protein [Bradyrhizobium sp. ARR65]